MRTFAFIGLLTAGLSGCVVYEKGRPDGDLHGGEPGEVDGSAGPADEGSEAALADSGLEEASPDVLLDFYPSEVAQGERFIGYLSVAGGDLDLAAVEGLRFYGDVALLSYDVRSDEVVISLEVADRAVTGEVDLLVELGGGEAIWLEGAFRIAEAAGADTGGDGANDDDAGCD